MLHYSSDNTLSILNSKSALVYCHYIKGYTVFVDNSISEPWKFYVQYYCSPDLDSRIILL